MHVERNNDTYSPKIPAQLPVSTVFLVMGETTTSSRLVATVISGVNYISAANHR